MDLLEWFGNNLHEEKYGMSAEIIRNLSLFLPEKYYLKLNTAITSLNISSIKNKYEFDFIQTIC